MCLITASMTVVRQRIECSIAKKRRGDTAQHEKGMARCVGVRIRHASATGNGAGLMRAHARAHAAYEASCIAA